MMRSYFGSQWSAEVLEVVASEQNERRDISWHVKRPGGYKEFGDL